MNVALQATTSDLQVYIMPSETLLWLE